MFNSPTNYTDPEGKFIAQAIGGGLGAGFGVYTAYTANPNASAGALAQAAAVGALSGIASTLPLGGGAAGSIAAGYGAGFLGNLANQALSGRKPLDFASANKSGLAGVLGGAAGQAAKGIRNFQGNEILGDLGQEFTDSFVSGAVAGGADLASN